MTDIPPGSWPAVEVDPDGCKENEASRPSTAATYVTSEESKDVIERPKDNVIAGKSKATRNPKKLGTTTMPDLPPEICETYAIISD